MRTEVTISNIYWNKGLANFFFRTQAYNTLEELVERSFMGSQLTLEALDDQTEGADLDNVEEMFYSDSVEEIADYYGIELDEKEDV